MNQQLPQQKKGMSTGCLVALIIVGVLVILIVVAGLVCYMKRGDLVQYGAITMTEEIKKNVAESPQPGVDTSEVISVADAFINHVRPMEEPEVEPLALYLQEIQHIRGDKVVDSLEARQFINAVYRAYPELEGEAPMEMESEAPMDTAGIDTMVTEDTTATSE